MDQKNTGVDQRNTVDQKNTIVDQTNPVLDQINTFLVRKRGAVSPTRGLPPLDVSPVVGRSGLVYRGWVGE